MSMWGSEDTRNVYAGLNSKKPQDKAGWLKPVATAAGAAGGFLVGGPAGAMAGAQLGGAAGGVAHDAANGAVTPEGLLGEVGQGVAGFNGLNTAMDTRSIIEAFMRNPHAFRAGFNTGGLVTGGGAMDQLLQMLQRQNVPGSPSGMGVPSGPTQTPQGPLGASSDVLGAIPGQVQQIIGRGPDLPRVESLQQASHPNWEAASSVLAQLLAAVPQPANRRNTKAIGAWAPALGVLAGAPADIAAGRRKSANADITAGNEARRLDYEKRKTAYDSQYGTLSNTLVGNATKPFAPKTEKPADEPYTQEEADAMGHPEWAGMSDVMVRRKMQGAPKTYAPKPAHPLMSRDALLASAHKYNQTGTWDISARDTVNRTAAANIAAEIRGGGTGELALTEAQFGADKKSLKDLQGMVDSANAFDRTIGKNVKVLRARANKIVDTGSPVLNKPLREAAQFIAGDRDQAAFNAARLVVIPEFARLIQNPRLVGQLTDQGREEVDAIIRGDKSINQMLEVLDVLELDAKNRIEAYNEQVGEITGRISGRGQTVGAGGVFKWPAGALEDSTGTAPGGR